MQHEVFHRFDFVFSPGEQGVFGKNGLSSFFGGQQPNLTAIFQWKNTLVL